MGLHHLGRCIIVWDIQPQSCKNKADVSNSNIDIAMCSCDFTHMTHICRAYLVAAGLAKDIVVNRFWSCSTLCNLVSMGCS